MPTLSVVILTYNQEDFISEAVESILLQEHDFVYEIIIGDDSSNDNTPDIIKSFCDKYPTIVKPILREKNIGPSKNLYNLLKSCTGVYIAILEGDDFWTDKLKIKKQISFLENNRDYIACTHRYKLVDETGVQISHEYFGPGRPPSGLYNIDHFKNYIYFGMLGSVLFRNIFCNSGNKFEIIQNAHPFIGDITLNLILALEGRIFVSDENMAAHRIIVRKNGTNYKSIIYGKNQSLDRLDYLRRLETYAKNYNGKDFEHKSRNEYLFLWALLFVIRYPNLHNLHVLNEIFKRIDNKWFLFKYSMCKIFRFPQFLLSFAFNKLKIIK